jgi:hypothetical protein
LCPSSSPAAVVQERSPRGPHLPPSPPAIATLSGTGEDSKNGSTRNGDHGSRHTSVTDYRPSPMNGHSLRSRSSGDPAPSAANDPMACHLDVGRVNLPRSGRASEKGGKTYNLIVKTGNYRNYY